jgi:hypothetical protein
LLPDDGTCENKKDDNGRKYYDAEMGREGLRVPFGPDGIPAETKTWMTGYYIHSHLQFDDGVH